jgi:hypothetical protein
LCAQHIKTRVRCSSTFLSTHILKLDSSIFSTRPLYRRTLRPIQEVKTLIEAMQYQHFLFVFLFVVGMAFAVPSPHIGMVDNDRVRDVGAVYSQPGYSSKPTFLLMNKQEPRCVPLYVTPSPLTS